MTEETMNLMPGEEKGVLLKTEDKYDVIASSPAHLAKVLKDAKMIPTGEWSFVFTNTNDSPVTIKISRK
jgi:hypothetical protein